jgi:hypothetical protein
MSTKEIYLKLSELAYKILMNYNDITDPKLRGKTIRLYFVKVLLLSTLFGLINGQFNNNQFSVIPENSLLTTIDSFAPDWIKNVIKEFKLKVELYGIPAAAQMPVRPGGGLGGDLPAVEMKTTTTAGAVATRAQGAQGAGDDGTWIEMQRLDGSRTLPRTTHPSRRQRPSSFGTPAYASRLTTPGGSNETLEAMQALNGTEPSRRRQHRAREELPMTLTPVQPTRLFPQSEEGSCTGARKEALTCVEPYLLQGTPESIAERS